MAARRGAAFSCENKGLIPPTATKPAIDNNGVFADLSNDFGSAEKPDTRIDMTERKLREMRATALAIAIRDTHPDDARQLLTAALIDLSAGMPSGAIFATVREDAKWWAGLATPLELMEVLAAAMESLRSRAMHRDMRKRLFMRLWRSFTPKQQADFLSYATKEGGQ